MTIGVILIGTAVFMAASSDRIVPGAIPPSPAVFSTGFLVWSTIGIAGLLLGLVAARRPPTSPTRHEIAPWEPVTALTATTSVAPVVARFGTVLETVEGSA